MGFDAGAAREIGERAGEPEWLVHRRMEAFERFEALGWPDPESEEWRYTDLKGFELDALVPAFPSSDRRATLDGVPADVLAALGDVRARDGLAVQLDADLVHVRLAPEASGRGVVLCDLATAARDHQRLLRDALGTAGWPASEAKFEAFAQAFGAGGTFAYVPRGVTLALPIQTFRWVASPGGAAAGHTVIIVEEGASLTYIDHVASPAHKDARAASVSLVEIYARQAAQVSYLAVQDHADDVWHFHVQRAMVERDATLNSLAATLGGRFSRSTVETILHGQGSSAEMLGVYFADDDQHFDHRSLQEHAAPNTTSKLVYKGALKGTSRAVYSGLIHIAKDAPRSDANQINRNLVLSDHAKADSIPYLEIENNDVRCGHGASVGPPDADQVFYLRSRGLNPKDAEELIVRGYFQEILDRVHVPEVRTHLEAAVEAEVSA